jgi:PST family polysaccharide transporter
MFDLHKATLYAAGHNSAVGRLYVSYDGLLWLGCWIFIPLIGLWGYGIAELLALPSYFLVHRSLVKFCGSPNYWSAFWIVLAAFPVLIGTLWLSPLPSFSIFVVSYGLLFSLNKSVKSLPLELWSIVRARNKPVTN